MVSYFNDTIGVLRCSRGFFLPSHYEFQRVLLFSLNCMGQTDLVPRDESYGHFPLNLLGNTVMRIGQETYLRTDSAN